MTNCTTGNCYKNISGKLWAMPIEYKKWKNSLDSYRSEFSFMRDSQLRESVAMLRMNYDYQISLFNWLEPKLTFKEHHKYILYQILSSIYEALLLDYLKVKIKETSDPISKQVLNEYLGQKNKGLGSFINLIFDSGDSLINSNWKLYLNLICELRNTVHPSKLKNPKLVENSALKLGLENAVNNLERFISNLKKRYT